MMEERSWTQTCIGATCLTYLRFFKLLFHFHRSSYKHPVECTIIQNYQYSHQTEIIGIVIYGYVTLSAYEYCCCP